MKKSFTLIELIVVIAIIAVLAAIIAPHALRAIEKAQTTRIVGDLKSVKSASMGFNADTGGWPVLINNITYTSIDNTYPLLKVPAYEKRRICHSF
jgi:general secretion pathway protein G